ncbi:WD40 repeat-containing protein [Acaryochloris sp. CCMEE 5410]|uniref:WD40 repeat-containing protein n=1 Tax=Acaryochloris sp. CCMEE 5410 TaxID=310037 RepID=UPI00024851AB|nr:WD40 repeat-containing protein [Acaryochloris sp. CCMEE 5410]KAI9130038.1 hypothetical protein ON05_030805 [Acaryochloris sp. CCMEE 5410]
MSTVELSLVWEDADNYWDLPVLYKDLGKFNRGRLTKLHKALLRGALCGVSLSEVANKLDRKINGLRADLSAGLYSFVSQLLCEKEIQYDAKVCWQQIPRLLGFAGYRLLGKLELNISLESISEPIVKGGSLRAADIIKSIEDNQISDRLNNSNSKLAKEVADSLIQKGESVANLGQYETAIQFYRVPVEQDLSYKHCLVKIAICFDQLQRYSDAVTIALEALPLFTDKDNVGKLYGVLGSAYQELAIKTRDDLVLRQAVSYYRRAFVRSDGPNVLGVWNIFDLFSEFSLLKESESDMYIRKAKLALCEFKDAIKDPKSNFPRYRQKIVADALRIQLKINDEWLRTELRTLKSL